MRIREVRLLRLAVGKAGEPDRVVEAEALQEFGIVIDLPAVPEPRIEIEAVAPGLLQLWRGRQTVGTGIGRAERGMPLRQEGGLTVDFPAVGFGVRQLGPGLRSD